MASGFSRTAASRLTAFATATASLAEARENLSERRRKADTTYVSGANISAVTTQDTAVAGRALTALSEDEALFRDSVYEFADR